MGWGRRVVERFRTDGAPRVLVLVLVVAALVVWDRSNDVDLRDDVARQVRDSELAGRYVVPLTPAQAGRFGDGDGPTNKRAEQLAGEGNAELADLFVTAFEAQWGSDVGYRVERYERCRYWPVRHGGGGEEDELVQLCWDSDRPTARPASFAQALLVRD